MGLLSRVGPELVDVVEIQETQGEDHVFHLNDLHSQKAQDLIKDLAHFFNRERPHFLSMY